MMYVEDEGSSEMNVSSLARLGSSPLASVVPVVPVVSAVSHDGGVMIDSRRDRVVVLRRLPSRNRGDSDSAPSEFSELISEQIDWEKFNCDIAIQQREDLQQKTVQ